MYLKALIYLPIKSRAEAERMRMKASAYKQYGDAAILSLVLEALPQIAAEVSAPLAKTDEIVMIGEFSLIFQWIFLCFKDGRIFILFIAKGFFLAIDIIWNFITDL